jgi:hypothetical protein
MIYHLYLEMRISKANTRSDSDRACAQSVLWTNALLSDRNEPDDESKSSESDRAPEAGSVLFSETVSLLNINSIGYGS